MADVITVLEDDNMVDIRNFTANEISEINSYIRENMSGSILSRQVFPYTEDIDKKCEVYTTVFRLINSAKNYANDKTTKEKLEKLLKENQEIYEQLYILVSSLHSSELTYGSSLKKKKMVWILQDYETNFKVNKLIDIFYVFAEKLVLLDTNKVVGLELDTEEGVEFYKKLQAGKDDVPVQNDGIVKKSWLD